LIDLIIRIDAEGRLKDVVYIGKCREWFEEKVWTEGKGQKIDYLFGTVIKREGGIVEIQNRFFKYQWVDEKDGATLYLSRDGVLLEFFEQTIQHVAEGIQIYDKNGYFLYANSASEALEHYKKDDFKGKHLLDLYDVKEEYSTVLTVLRTQKPVDNRCDRFKVKNGKALTTINSGYPLKIDGKLYGAVVFESDLSVLKQIKNRTLNLESYTENGQSISTDQLYTFDDIVHSSEKMKDIIHFAKKVSLTDSSVLIVGATGTGKELIAQSIHSFSRRRHKPFIDVNCSAVPSNLFESMFFGTEKGAFTGSITKQGFFEIAEGGTIFLDEVNSISPEMQAKLLRVLQEKRFQRIGGNQYIKCDVRVISALNEDPFELIKQHKIRKDFYYRVSTIKINIPPLQDRKEDIIVLSQHFLNKLCNYYGRQNLKISEKVINAFLEYDWPGNVRELQNVIEYSFNKATEESSVLEFDYLPDYMQSLESIGRETPQHIEDKTSPTKYTGTFEERLKQFEQQIIRYTLEQYKGNVTKSAEALGMSRQSLQYRIKKLEL
jgi:arginine utilization regulatory protein